eukprot:GFUD01005175.1.p1 GENE.GFUD01005175.1~~GFUD01005175.1.p1  ORF type:complete len:561 (-),score=123.58 GFUD01005175.1:153-1835(-)
MIFVSLVIIALGTTNVCSSSNVPNIILLVVDDLGIGDIGCFGNTSLPTPNIDSLCRDGAKLEHHLSSATLCTPSRAALLTGRYAIRMGMTGVENTPPVLMYAAGRAGLPQNETTFAKIAKSKGYTTGAVGKWHLGLNEKIWGDQEHGPLGHGFDYFYGIPFTLVDGFEMNTNILRVKESLAGTELCVILFCLIPLRFFVGRKTFFSIIVLTMLISWFFLEHFFFTRTNWWQRSFFMEKFLNSFVMENNEVVEKPINLETLADKLIDKSLAFIESAVARNEPFLLYHAFAHVHTPLATDPRHKGKSVHGPYGDTIVEVDHSVGKILEALDKHDIAKNTFVYFTSDHGGDHLQIGTQGGYNGIFRGGKSNGALEGGMRVPGIVRWPAGVQPGVKVGQPTGLMDVLPTISHMIGYDSLVNRLDGLSFLDLLTQDKIAYKRTVFHHCASEIFAIRTALDDGKVYKMILKEPLLNMDGACPGDICPCYGPMVRINEQPLLYDIVEDPTESNEIESSSQIYQEVSKIMIKDLREFREDIETTKMKSQFQEMLKILPMPWLQPYLEK